MPPSRGHAIASKGLPRKVTRRLRAQRVGVEFQDAAVEFLAERGFDPEFGARPLRRTIQRHVENELSRLLLEGG
jgi:ATP-dependent Clp protease ATP-binding subunit ClpC